MLRYRYALLIYRPLAKLHFSKLFPPQYLSVSLCLDKNS